MTENKRFTIKEIDNFNYGIKVTDVIMDDGIELPQSTVCDLLNGLSDENEQLKQDLEEYCNFSLHDVLDKKNKEIEQLKKQLESREKAHTRCDELYWKLYDENEQLKKELESFKPIIFESDGKPVTLYKKGDVE